MAQIDFPASPTNGQIFTPVAGGPSWQYDGTKWVAATTGATAYAPIASPAFTGNPTAPTPPQGDADTSIATTAFVAASTAGATANVGRNLLHNSMFNVQQRGVGLWNTASAYTLDRWGMYFVNGTMSVGALPLNDGHRAQIGDEAAVWGLNVAVTGSATPGSIAVFFQKIEDVRRLAGKTVTVSFWASANIAARVGVSIDQYLGTGGSPLSVPGSGQSVAITQAMARYSLTLAIPSLAGKTVGSAGDSTVLNLWQSASTENPAGSGVGVQTASFVFWGVQLEIGTTATPLEKPDPVTQLQQCQRFYCTGKVEILGSVYVVGGYVANTVGLPVTMRSGNPAITSNFPSPTNTSTATVSALDGGAIIVNATATAIGTVIAIGTFTASADL